MSPLKYRQLLKSPRVQKVLVYQSLPHEKIPNQNNTTNNRQPEPPFEATSINVCDVNMANRVHPPKLCCCPEEEPPITTKDVTWVLYCLTIKLVAIFVFLKLSFDSGFWCASEKSVKLFKDFKIAFDASGERRREFKEKEEKRRKELLAQQEKGKVKGKPVPKEVAKPEPKVVPKASQKPDPKAAQNPVPKAAPKPVPKAAPKPDPKAAPKPVPKAAQKPDPKAAQKPVSKEAPKPDPKAAQKPDTKKPAPIDDFDYEGEPKNMKNIWNSMLINFVKKLSF